MKISPTVIPDVLVIEPKVFEDNRGFFMESWNEHSFIKEGLNMKFVQDNHSRSTQYTLRGLHYQVNQVQGKLVRCSLGEVYDVVVDLRNGHSTFGKWYGIYLSEMNKKMLYIPPGFAHGFFVTTEVADFQYKCTGFYAPEYEKCIRWDDPFLKISWPIPDKIKPNLSPKDKNGLLFQNATYFYDKT